jgi:outer membrane receptor protein involved in Fe transport
LPPISSKETSTEQISPKAGFIWTPARNSTVRFAYTKSLGGVSFDQSFRLEPSQVAGFNQAFRSLIPESVAGSTTGAKFETFGLAWDQKFDTATYVGIEADLYNSDVNRVIGAVDLNFPPSTMPSSTRQNLRYQEKSLAVTVNQLLGDCWSVGGRYQFTRSELDTTFPDIPGSVTSGDHTKSEASLHQLTLFGLLNLPCGFYSRAEGIWTAQENDGAQSSLPGADFWQFNFYAGYRFPKRHAQIQLGLLNLTDTDYRLNPLNLYSEMPRGRTVAVSFQFNF